MAEEIIKIEDFKFKEGQVASRELTRKFGREEDYAEIHVLSLSDQVLASDFNFINYNTPSEAVDSDGLISEINMDPVAELSALGYTSGKYKIKLNLLRRKILNTPLSVFFLKEISSSRREIKLKLNNSFNNTETIASIRNFINEIETNIFFKDFGLNFQDGNILTAINIAVDEREIQPSILVKLLEPLPANYIVNDQCSVVEEIIDPTILTINLGRPEDIDTSIPLQGPNFKIDTRLNSSIPSGYKTYDDILNSSTVLSSSYNELLSSLTDEDVLNIPYDYIRPVSGTLEDIDIPSHFENFIHFGSAVERLKNFEYKLSLIELYDSQLSDINSITGDTSASSAVITNKNNTTLKKDNIIKGFDGYERFLYFTSGSNYTWPKSNQTSPYVLYSTTSSQAKAWLGDDRSSFSNYGGQLLSASIYDKGNVNNLERLIPNHVLDNKDNDQYKLFVNMIGQHFDNVWTHIKHITEINDTHHTRGISRDLVYFTLKSLGVEAFDQFENSNLIEYILGQGTSGSAFYDVPVSQSLVTASNAGSLPKKDLSKEVWKRLYHNAPYLLKTKGTERGIKALISCYGIPSTILNVKEYGGPVKDKTGYKTFSYEKSGLALNGETTSFNKYFLKTNWNSLFTQYLLGRTNLEPILDQPANTFNIVDNLEEGVYERGSQKTITFRIKPKRTENTYHLFGFSASNAGSSYINTNNQAHFVLTPYTGNDISSSGDSTQYGKIDLFQNQILRASTPNFPVYNGDFWNVFIGVDEDYDMCSEYYSGSFGAYQANFNKNISSHFGYFNLTFGNPYTLNGNYHFDIRSTFGGQVIDAPAIPATTASTEVFTIDINADLSSANFQDYDLTITDFHGQSLTLRHNPTLPVATGPNQFPQSIITPDLTNPGNGVIETNWLFLEGITVDLQDPQTPPFPPQPVSSATMDRAASIIAMIDFMLLVATQQNGFLDANGESNILVPAGNTNNNPSINYSIKLSLNPSSPLGIAPYNQGTVDANNFFPPQAFQSSSFYDSSFFESTVAGESNNFNIEFGPLFVSDVLLDSAPATLTGFTGGTNGAPGQNNVPGVGAEKVFFGGSQVGKNYFGYSGSLQEVRYYYGELLTHDTLKKQALEPFMYAGNTISSSFNHLVLRLPLGSNDQQFSSSFHPNSEIDFLGTVESDMDIQKWEEVIETHHHPTPDTVGISMTSEKVRIDEGTIDDNLLSTTIKSEVSTLDRQPQDFEDLGVFFSPTTEINEDIVYQLGSFRLDDYIGSPLPSAQTASVYEDLKALRKEYFKRVKNRYNYWDYVKLIQYIDHTLFKLVEQFVPAKANLKTGLLIEPHYLERTKFARELPIIEDGQTMTPGSYNTIDFQIDPEKQFTLEGTAGGGNVITTNNLLKTTGSNGQRQEQGTNFTINVSGHILDEQQNIAQAPIRPFNPSGLRGNIISNSNYASNDGAENFDQWVLQDDFLVVTYSPITNGIKMTVDQDYINFGAPNFSTRISQNLHDKLEVGKSYQLKFEAKASFPLRVVIARANGTFDQLDPDNAMDYTNNPTISSTEFQTFTADFGPVDFIGNSSDPVSVQFFPAGPVNDISVGDTMEIRNVFIFIKVAPGKPPGYVERKSSVLLGNATKAKQSNRYYRSVKEIKSHKNVEPFNTNLFPNPFDPLINA